MVGPETHDWHQRYWRWQQPTRGGLPCATAAPPPPPPPPCRKGASQPCESDSVRRQLLDMFPRAKSGSLPAFELVFFLVLLSGCPQLTCQARTKGRWNKGGKWRIFGIWPEMCWTLSFVFFSPNVIKTKLWHVGGVCHFFDDAGLVLKMWGWWTRGSINEEFCH